jgi:hypothetical protein
VSGWRVCGIGMARSGAGIQSGRCCTPSTRRTAGRGRVGLAGWCACGEARGGAGTRSGRCCTPSTRREAGRGGRGGCRAARGRRRRAADVAHPARGARRVGVGAVVAVPLADAGAVPQFPRPEPARLRAPAEAGSAAAECEPPPSQPVDGAARDASRARRGRGAAQMPRPVPQPASVPATRGHGGVQAAP